MIDTFIMEIIFINVWQEIHFKEWSISKFWIGSYTDLRIWMVFGEKEKYQHLMI